MSVGGLSECVKSKWGCGVIGMPNFVSIYLASLPMMVLVVDPVE